MHSGAGESVLKSALAPMEPNGFMAHPINKESVQEQTVFSTTSTSQTLGAAAIRAQQIPGVQNTRDLSFVDN